MPHSQPEGYLSVASDPQGLPVLVLHAWWGLNADIQTLCDRLAIEGMTAFALDLYHGQVAKTIAAAEELGSALDSRFEQVLAEIAQATDWLSKNYGTGQQGISLVAFSLGAWYALEQSNADPEHIRKVAVFYGTRQGDYSQSRAAYLGHFAEEDEYEPQGNVDAMAEAIRQAGRPLTLYTYPKTGHWFFEPGREEAYDLHASQLAWKRTLAFMFS